MGPGDLAKIMFQLPVHQDENLIIGTDYPDDAAVYRLNEEVALIQTVDFFPPVVDDPFQYGQIAAANALSDVYAMGGRPLTAMNIVCFPCRKLGSDLLLEILKGGAEKVAEAGGLLVGGHTINDDEPKYGLAVTGLVAPDQLLTKGGAEPGDLLILTKPLGAGVITTAHKGDLVPGRVLKEMVHWMTTLNKDAAEVARQVGVRSCTDVTGFGLLGHAYEMIRESKLGILFYLDAIPFVEGTLELAQQGLVPGGARVNLEFLRDKIISDESIDHIFLDLLCDPQTSGGLLMAVGKDNADRAFELLQGKGLYRAAVIGELTQEREGQILLR